MADSGEKRASETSGGLSQAAAPYDIARSVGHSSGDTLDSGCSDNGASSSLGDDAKSSTASLTSSILDYRTIHGRSFYNKRGEGESWTPNDETWMEAMDIYHHTCTLSQDGRLFLAPLKPNIPKALDIGTGTGIWAIDFADQFPTTEVIGTDLSRIQPTSVPPNCKFEVDDATLNWTWEDNTFDYAYVRALFGSIADWDRLYREAFRVCKPGGWIEHSENSVRIESDDNTVLPGSAMDQWHRVYWEAGKKYGRTFKVLEDNLQVECMKKAGFIDIGVWNFKCPIGDWPQGPKLKEVGLFARAVMETDTEGFILYLWGDVLGWKRDAILAYIAHLRRELRHRKIHSFYRQRVVWGRKPG